MIDPKSLRIGNTVIVEKRVVPIHELLTDHAVVIWETDAFMSPAYPNIPYDKISGIPLSEQELIRLGFRDEQIYEAVRCWRTDHFALSYHANEPKNLYLHGYGLDSNPVLHIHQLQNLYYSLTGTELTYKVENETIKQ